MYGPVFYKLYDMYMYMYKCEMETQLHFVDTDYISLCLMYGIGLSILACILCMVLV